MVLPSRTQPDSATRVRELDRGWAERLAAEAELYARRERRSTLRRAALCLLLAFAVVIGGIAEFRYETDTRPRPIADPRSPVWVTVTLPKGETQAAPGPADAAQATRP